MKIPATMSIPERLAALAGLAAAIASLAGFIPGLYRDPRVVIAQSHGYDVGNLVAVLVLWIALAASARGSVPARLVAVGALGCLIYSYVTYAFLIVLNPVTVLYIAVLGFGGWALATGLASVDRADVEAAGVRLRRRSTGTFLLVLAAFFALTWLGQIAGAVTSGHLPAALQSAAWPMNPIYVEDLGFVLPLMALAGYRVLKARAGAARLAIPLLVFMPLLAVTIIAMAASGAADGQAFDAALCAIFGVVATAGVALAALALAPRRGRPMVAAPAH